MLDETVHANGLDFIGSVAGEKFGMDRSKEVVIHCFSLVCCKRIFLCARLLI